MVLARWACVHFLLCSLCFAGIIEDVRGAINQENFAAADAYLETYRAQHPVGPEYLEALSWMARASLAVRDNNQAASYAKQTEALVRQELKHRPLDAEPHLPVALGAALEVESRVLAAQGKQSQAVALLQRALIIYRNTSITSRLQKNLNLLGLAGKLSPPLVEDRYLGPKPTPLSQLRGSPVLLFFWAHWCGDCKAEAPIIARLRTEFSSNGLRVLAPTQLYGYAARGASAAPKDELSYIKQVWRIYYPGLQDVSVPVSKTNFDAFGASTTPTLVLLGRDGRVALYHPGAMSYEDLRSSIGQVLMPAAR